MAISRQELGIFLASLLRVTEGKRIKWSDTPDENVFRLLLKDGAVLIERVQPGPDQFAYLATLLNGNNQPIADYQADNSEQEARMLQNLFNAARDSALKTEDVFKSLVGELERLSK